MSIDPIVLGVGSASPSAVGGTTGGVDTLARPGTSGMYGLSNDDFMKIFLAQLQNQDPSNPVNDSQFLDQMAQMTMISTLQQVEKALSGSQLAEASGMIGKHVEGLDVDGASVSGTVDRVVQSQDAGLVLMVGSQAIQPESITIVTDAATSSATGGTTQ